MRSEVYWIPAPTTGRLAIMPRPRGGDWLEDEVRAWRSSGIDIIVSLLTHDEIAELDLADEESMCKAHGIQFLTLAIPDRKVPAKNATVLKLATDLAHHLMDGKNIAIHCRQGLGRAPLIAICVLVVAGLDPTVAISRVGEARGCRVPETLEQEQWIADFVKELPVLTSR